MFLPPTNILKFSKIVHIINLFYRCFIIVIITFFYLFIYLWNNQHCKMKIYQVGINSINQVREGPSHSFKGYCRKQGIEGIKKKK